MGYKNFTLSNTIFYIKSVNHSALFDSFSFFLHSFQQFAFIKAAVLQSVHQHLYFSVTHHLSCLFLIPSAVES